VRGDEQITRAKANPFEAIKSVMKDIDFEQLEGQLMYSGAHSDRIRNALWRDASFLRDCGLIDYSLLVVKLDRYRLLERAPELANKKTEWFPAFAADDKDGRYAYNVGIVDYLQEYDTGKRLEKWMKILKSCNRNVDVSAQDPQRYLDRFQALLGKILTSRFAASI
jgi:hypothetical protein